MTNLTQERKIRVNIWDILLIEICILMIILGVYYRFSWRNWSEGANLHPDEYGLTNTLTQLHTATNFKEYINTRISMISPYNRYDEYGQLLYNGPDNRMRWGQWPIILIRWAGEAVLQTGYDEIRLLGRTLSAVADCITLLFLFFIGKRLLGWRIGLLATALSALAVLQIQQSHYMTVDTFALAFTMATLYAGVRIAQIPAFIRKDHELQTAGKIGINPRIWFWLVLFGIGYGMTVASKINLAVLGAILPAALFISIADTKLHYRQDIGRILGMSALMMFIGCFMAIMTFRLTQPASFRAETGDTTLFTLHLNQDWVDSMEVASMESKGIGGGPPAEQWTHRTAILFPLMNMVFWGMGLPLGLAAWGGVIAAGWLLLKKKTDWRFHLLTWSWTVCYFLFMGTRWVKSMRYFLPIYPILCLFAAWGLLTFVRWAYQNRGKWSQLWRIIATAGIGVVIAGTLVWSYAFVHAVYIHRHTRILATEWMFTHIPGAVNYVIDTESGETTLPVALPDAFELLPDGSYKQDTIVQVNGNLKGILIPKPRFGDGGIPSDVSVNVWLGGDLLAQQLTIPITTDAEGNGIRVDFPSSVSVVQGQLLTIEIINNGPVTLALQKQEISNESWDEGLPVRFMGYDPFSQTYLGNTMEVRWYDDDNKKEMFLERLQASDYIILPSQRALWSAIRIPVTYPMTIEYYQALFSGELGYELVAEFQSPFVIGPLQVSDLGGTWAWNAEPELPVFNFNPLAAEEAFSVYDHPPVWIFKKTADFDLTKAEQILDRADLSQVVVQSPRDATFYKTEYSSEAK